MYHRPHTADMQNIQKNMTNEELYILTHPDKWPHKGQLPLVRREGNPVRNKEDVGIVMKGNLCRVWTGVYLGDTNPTHGTPIEYETLEKLLKRWTID
jgi:hypothetical protein